MIEEKKYGGYTLAELEMMTLAGAARAVGLHPHTLNSRLKAGWTFEDAVTTPTFVCPESRKHLRASTAKKEYVPRKYRTRRPFLYKGQMLTVDQLPLQTSYDGFISRLERGWSVEDAVDTPLPERKFYEYKGKQYSMWQLPTTTVNRWTIRTRIMNGWSVEAAVDTPANQPRYFYKGQWLLAKQLPTKVSWWTVHRRLKRGWSLEDAVDTPPGCVPEPKSTNSGEHDQ